MAFELDQAGKSPVLVFENVRGHAMPLVTNVAGNRRLLAACLGVAPGDLPTAFRERCQKYIPCETVARGAWDDVVIEGDDVDLTKLPIPLQFAVDAAPYITAGQIVARDPVTGVDTTGFHRLMLKGKNRMGVSLHSRRRLYEFHRRAEERGESLPAAITLGTHPLHYMGSMVYAYPPQVRKYEIIGGLFGEPYRLARCGVADLEVPAGAEIIIEGEILADVHEPEGPFGEFTGYASYRSTQNVFVAHRIRMRRDAMLHSVVSGMSRDHITVSCITREGEILNALKRNLPNVRTVHVPHTTCGAFMAFVSMKKIAEGEPQMAMMATLRHRALHQVRHRGGRRRRRVQHQRRDVGGRDPHARREGHRLHPRCEGRDPRPDVGPADLHADQDGHRRHPADRPRFRRAPDHLRRASGPGARPSGRGGRAVVTGTVACNPAAPYHT